MNNSSFHRTFEQQYISLREKEGRLYTDEETKRLPYVPHSHPLKNEWIIRAESSKRLTNYLSKKSSPLQILEIGCGNGWLSHQLTSVQNAVVTGMDINATELEQAKRVFPSIRFLHGDLQENTLEESFDIIVFAASFQYFKSAKEVVEYCFHHLKQDGEVHIIDTQFYLTEDVEQAGKRSFNYFEGVGFPDMHAFYFHHTLLSLECFQYDVLYRPETLLNKVFNKGPFPWIRIKNKC